MTVWTDAVELGAQGRYAQAREVLSRIRQSEPAGSLALSTRASHARQVGADGADWDRQALACAADPESTADALIGLAADAVANGDAAEAEQMLGRAAEVIEGTSGLDEMWRPLTRWHWVSAERALLAGDPATAYIEARAARRSCTGRSIRHETKSAIIAMATGDEFALGRAQTVMDVLRAHRWATLQWPLALVLDDARAQHAVPADVLQRAWSSAEEAVEFIAGKLPQDLQQDWAHHPGVRRIRSGR